MELNEILEEFYKTVWPKMDAQSVAGMEIVASFISKAYKEGVEKGREEELHNSPPYTIKRRLFTRTEEQHRQSLLSELQKKVLDRMEVLAIEAKKGGNIQLDSSARLDELGQVLDLLK